MRTTIDIPNELMDKAREVSRTTTKRETIIAALEELIRKGEREGLRELAGKMEIDIDVAKARERPPT